MIQERKEKQGLILGKKNRRSRKENGRKIKKIEINENKKQRFSRKENKKVLRKEFQERQSSKI